jgi:hypothetical protein
MAERTPTPDAAITGVATGNLGTGTALDDTQVYSVDALATAEHPDAAGGLPQDEPVAAPPAAAPASVAISPASTRPVGRRHPITGSYPVGILTAVVVALIAVAAVLTMRDGGFAGGGAAEPGLAGAASFPPPPSFGPLATNAAPAASRPPKHHGHGHGQASQ